MQWFDRGCLRRLFPDLNSGSAALHADALHAGLLPYNKMETNGFGSH